MNKLTKPYNIYTIIWIVYLLQGILYQSSGLFSQGLFLLILGFGFVAMIDVVQQKNNSKFLNALTALLIVFVIYGLFRILKGPVRSYVENYSTLTYIKTYLLSLSPIYVYYRYSKSGQVDEKWFRSFFFVFLVLAIVSFFDKQAKVLLTAEGDEITNNTAYMFVNLLPMCFFFRKKTLVQYVLISILAVFTLTSMKRGAVLVFAVGLVPFVLGTLKMTKGAKKYVVIAVIALFGVFLFSQVKQMFLTDAFFQYRVEQTLEGNSSERDLIYARLWDAYINEYNVFDKIIGRGADATIEVAGMYAHNDWLEALIDQGLFGAFLFAYFWFSFIMMFKKSNKGTLCSLALLVLFLIGFTRTFFSMSIGQMPFYYSAVLGYCMANYKKLEFI